MRNIQYWKFLSVAYTTILSVSQIFQFCEEASSRGRNVSTNFHIDVSGRFQAAVVAFEGRIWAIGGCESWSPLNSLEIYDPSTDSWSIGPSLNTPRRGCGLAVLKGDF